MAMFVEINNKPNQISTFKKGQKVPPEMWRITTRVEADNAELVFIEDNIGPIFNNKVFVGETAKTIVANWNNWAQEIKMSYGSMVGYADLIKAFAALKPETEEEEEAIAKVMGFKKKAEDKDTLTKEEKEEK